MKICLYVIFSFHVGSGVKEFSAYQNALENARSVFDKAKEEGYNMTLLDVGGGFPASREADITFEEIASRLSQAVDDLFPKNVRVIAEPGRFYSSPAFTLCTQVISRRTVPTEENSDRKFMYYLNDGIYGSFRALALGYIHPVMKCKIYYFFLRSNGFGSSQLITLSFEKEPRISG